MAFSHKNQKGNVYYLHVKIRKLASGKEQKLFYFSKDAKGALDELPKGYKVIESKTGLPLLKKV